jgi:hypothetical protein
LILGCDDNVRTIWKIVKKETSKHSMVEENTSIKINDDIINNPELIAHSFTTYFL